MTIHKEETHVARAWDGKLWHHRLYTTEAQAMDDARTFQDIYARDAAGNEILPYMLIEVASCQAGAEIVAQWVGHPGGYRRVTGR